MVGTPKTTRLSSQRNKLYRNTKNRLDIRSQCTNHKAPCVTQKPKLTEELKRWALNIPKQLSARKSPMESDRSLMRGEPVSSRQCGQICVSTRKASDREQFHHSDTSNTSSRTCPHKAHCLHAFVHVGYIE